MANELSNPDLLDAAGFVPLHVLEFALHKPVPSAFLNGIQNAMYLLDSTKHNRVGDEQHSGGFFRVEQDPRPNSTDVARKKDLDALDAALIKPWAVKDVVGCLKIGDLYFQWIQFPEIIVRGDPQVVQIGTFSKPFTEIYSCSVSTAMAGESSGGDAFFQVVGYNLLSCRVAAQATHGVAVGTHLTAHVLAIGKGAP